MLALELVLEEVLGPDLDLDPETAEEPVEQAGLVPVPAPEPELGLELEGHTGCVASSTETENAG